MRDKTYDRLQQLTRALSVIQDENYRKWLEAEIMRARVKAVGERDATIREAYASGMTYQSIGEAVGLTRQRVAKICEVAKPDPQLHNPQGCGYCESGEAMRHMPEYGFDDTYSETRKGEE